MGFSEQIRAMVGDLPTRPGMRVVWEGMVEKASLGPLVVMVERRLVLLQGESSVSMAVSSSLGMKSERITPPSRERMDMMYSMGVVAGMVRRENLGS